MGGKLPRSAKCGQWLLIVWGIFIALNVKAQLIKMHGAVSLEKLLESHKSAIEKRAGVAVELRANGAGRGLANLCSGQADIALMAGSLQGVASAMNQEKPDSVDTSNLREFFVGKAKIVFITHPEVGVKTLSDIQLQAILTGVVTNWSKVGGADLRIRLVISFPGDGVRVWVQEKLLKGRAYSETALVRRSAEDISIVVSQVRGACAMTLDRNVVAEVAHVHWDKQMELPFALVTKGEPAGHIKRVVEAATALLGENKTLVNKPF